MIKRFTAVLLALILIFGSAFSAFATDNTEHCYNNPISDIPSFGEEIFPSDAEIFSDLMPLLENTSLTELFNDVMANFDPMISGTMLIRLIGYFYFFMFFLPMWVVAQF